MASIIEFMFVGLLQGFLEWLPISSQGNLVLFMVPVLGVDPSFALSLSLYLHFGTGTAALTYFRKDYKEILQRKPESKRRLFQFLLITTVVTSLIGLPLFLLADVTSIYGNALLTLTGIALLLTGLIQRRARRIGTRTLETLTAGDGLILGIMQGFSAIPGVSRSGLTTSTLLIQNFRGEEALRISFLMSVPAVYTAGLGLLLLGKTPPLEPTFLIALASSFISALISIDLLLNIAKRFRFWALCILLGVLTILSQLFPSFL